MGRKWGFLMYGLAGLAVNTFAAQAFAAPPACAEGSLTAGITQLRHRVELAQRENDGKLAGTLDEREGTARLTALADCLLERRTPGYARARAAGNAAFRTWIETQFRTQTDAELLLAAAHAYLTTRGERAWDVDLWVDIPAATAMLQRSSAIAPELDGARALILLGSLECQRPALVGGQPRAGMSLLERAATLTERAHLAVQLNMAEYCAVALRDRDLFHGLLHEVLGRESGTRYSEDNESAKRRAHHLLTNATALFPE